MNTIKFNNTACFAFVLIVICLVLSACGSKKLDIAVVNPFVIDKYLGRWYEIGRTDNRFQRGLVNAYATYSRNADGTIKVINRAYNPNKKAWKSAIGKAKFVDVPSVGRLKVSFFGPFYGGYNVVAIDDHYQHVLVMGDSADYMWILSRQKTLSDKVKLDYLEKAKAMGVDTEKLIWTNHKNFKQ